MTGLTDTNQLARITYQEPEFNFGEVTQGDVVKHDFHFTNTGKVPLIITIARASCGCTTPTWPKEAIPPGGTGVISAVFKTEHMLEEQTKTIWVAGNTVPNQTRVTLVGRVKSVKQ